VKKTGLVLSGGGARTIAHLGIIKAFEEEGISFHTISGSSAGAVIAALYAGGLKPKEILDLLVKLRVWSFASPVIPKRGLLGMNNAEKLLREHLPVKTFEELQIPVCLSATDINSGKSVCFSQGDLIKPLLASCCIPVLFNPVEIEGRSYIDGGILNNLPVDLIRDEVGFVVALHCNPIDHEFKPSGVKSMVERTMMMAITCNVYPKRHLCDIFIEPEDLKTYKVLEFNKAEEIFEIGYQYAIANMHTFKLKRLKEHTHDISGADTSGDS
jgi:NTE family protein